MTDFAGARRMKTHTSIKRLVAGLSAGAALALLSLNAWADAPAEVVEERTSAIAKVLEKPDSEARNAELTRELNETLDFAYLASQAFGEHWEARTPEERAEFLDLLQRMLQANYQDKLSGRTLNEDYTITFGDERTRGSRAFVRGEVTREGKTYPVVYRLYQDGESWRIYDLVIDDISLEETYREGYVPIIEDEGWGELIRLMRERIEEMEKD
ncbi:ABC transporter substrate-binding protein [Lujinxingia vulgaris]|uniref:ABC transporter substrate-binding protein n=2 Tax=Lujinxingia vulgaris TaxID=2600176 RepID=A0A5C6XPR2_9DELT|nr:ABC transporter substrate-binding protein [Lujinxingia vulgaris]